MKSLSLPPVGLLLTLLALPAFDPVLLHAEDVIVTGCVGSTYNKDIAASCPANLGTSQLDTSESSATPQGAGRSKTMYGVTTTATWAITPTLGSSSGAYRVYVSRGTSYYSPPDLHVKIVATTNCTLADTNYVSQTEIDTPAFQTNATLNVWTPVAVITNSSRTPTITFSYASGGYSRWYMDEVRFENLALSAATPARITQILHTNVVLIAGTGPINHPFALFSSTNPVKALNQWTPEQTNTDATGTFSFSLTPGSAKARFFLVLTQ
jgi:hypothetical protein